MERLELIKRSGYSRVVFSENEIVLYKRDREIVIPLECIENIEYVKPSFLNYILAIPCYFGGTYPGRLEIHLNKKIGTTKLYLVKIKNSEVDSLPEIYKSKFIY